MDLNEIRNKIDKIDRELMGLIEERFEYSIRSRKFKTAVNDPEREKQVISNIKNMHFDLIKNELRENFIKELIKEGKLLQSENKGLVAFQGEHGAYGEVASRKLMPDSFYIPCVEFIDVFKGVSEGYFDFGVVPVENSLEGSVTEPNEILVNTDLNVIGEINIRINHCLLAPQGSDHRMIKMVYSHPQALAQCRGFISRNKLEPRPFYDTAGSAKMISREKPFGAAAIASELAAELYDLMIIKSAIEDQETNYTRFLILSEKPYTGEGNKCSIVFATKHESGKLFNILKLFAESNVNLTRISSAPRRDDPGNYNFFCDFEGSDKDEKIKKILEKIKKNAVHLNFLGCYPSKDR